MWLLCHIYNSRGKSDDFDNIIMAISKYINFKLRNKD